MVKKRACFVVLLKPRYRELITRIISPSKKNACWSEGRAEKELKFFEKTAKFSYKGNLSMPFSSREVYRGEVISKVLAKKQGHI